MAKIEPTPDMIVDLRDRLLADRSHDGAGLYAVIFEHGVKFGISGDIRQRLRTYHKIWCLPVIAVHVLCIRRKLLIEAEKLVLSHWPDVVGDIEFGRRCGEFIFGLTEQHVFDEFEGVTAAYFGELVDYA